MNKHTSFIPVSALLCLFFITACHQGSIRRGDWPVYLGDQSRTHYSELKDINLKNVRNLKVAWVYHTGDADTVGHSQIECSPIERNGVLYGTSPRLKLFALDAATGKDLWAFDPFQGASGTEVQLNANRGVTYWSSPDGKDDRLFYVAGSYLYAVDPKTGALVTAFGKQGRVDLHEGLDRDVKNLFVTSTSPGVLYHDLLILGTRVAEGGEAAPGYIRAYDVHTGKRRWIFHTIPWPGEQGYDSWKDKDAWKTAGGVNTWAGMSLDEKRGVVYVPTGSATPDFYGGDRKGMDLFSDCVLALDAATGHLKWYYQTVHHDLWDRDLPAPPNLVTIHRDGKEIDAIAQITKTGFVFVLDRDNGKPLFPVKETPVPDTSGLQGEAPWPTQPIPEMPLPFMPQHFSADDINPLVPDSSRDAVLKQLAGLRMGNMFLPPGTTGQVMFPGFDGGAEWGGASYDPLTQVLYVNANQVPWALTMVPSGTQTPASSLSGKDYGHSVYEDHCMTCHGADRKGSGDYPSLRTVGTKYSDKQILGIIDHGRGMMPSFKQLPGKDKEAVVAFLLGLKQKKRLVARENEKAPQESFPGAAYRMTGYIKLHTPEGYPASTPPWGTLTAINLNSGKRLWQVPLGEYPELARKGVATTGTENYGGAVVTAGGLLFIAATLDGKIRAFDKSTGTLVWEGKLPAAGFATPVTYAVNGKQYLVVACGGGKLDVPSGDAYVAFALP